MAKKRSEPVSPGAAFLDALKAYVEAAPAVEPGAGAAEGAGDAS